MPIYSDYSEEPKEHFEPLPEQLYRELYDIELANFDNDIAYYLDRIPFPSSVLEIGCGSGRVASRLSAAGHHVTGIDLSQSMISAARNACPSGTFYQMDMRHMDIDARFDAIVIAYNTLNLLINNEDLRRCLRECFQLLKRNGRLLLQLYSPTGKLPADGDTSFQFQIFDRPQGGKIVKEILRTFHIKEQTVTMEERYKIRPLDGVDSHRNFSHTFTLTCAPEPFWQELIKSSGFTLHSLASAYNDTEPPVAPTLLLIDARKKENRE